MSRAVVPLAEPARRVRVAGRLVPLLALAGLSVTGCAPALTLTRTVPSTLDPASTLHRLAVTAEGDPALADRAQEHLEEAIALRPGFSVVRGCAHGAACPGADAVIRIHVDPPAVGGATSPAPWIAGAGPQTSEARVIVAMTFRWVRADGSAVATRAVDAFKDGTIDTPTSAGARTFRTADALVLDAVDDCVRQFADEALPRLQVERVELDAAGPLTSPVQLLMRGDAAGAEAGLKAALDREPALAGAHFDLGLLAEARHDFVAAREHYEQATALGAPRAQSRLQRLPASSLTPAPVSPSVSPHGSSDVTPAPVSPSAAPPGSSDPTPVR